LRRTSVAAENSTASAAPAPSAPRTAARGRRGATRAGSTALGISTTRSRGTPPASSWATIAGAMAALRRVQRW
jgi:hypothetical protein